VALRIYSTLSGTKEEFIPIGDPVRMYVCGMTPKFHPHVGHARVFVAADIMRRYLEYRGYRVRHVQNFTDIDDKIIARAQLEGVDPRTVAENYSRSYFESMDALNVKRAHIYPTVTQYMPQIIAFVQTLLDRGYAYVSDGDVWYSVERFPEYGKLSGRTGEGQLAGVRKELEEGKRDPRDFALWKAAKPGEPAWDSPWGPGRPGWHIECSTMVRETLGDQIDIHSGGQDLIFPHHENEIAQSEAATGRHPFARYWPHVGLVTTDGEKMSHSLNNFFTVAQVLERYEPVALRLFLLTTHYRAPLAFGEEPLAAAARSLSRLRAALEGADRAELESATPWAHPLAAEFRARFEAAMDDDFNSAGALGHLFDLAREINRLRAAGDEATARPVQAALHQLAAVLGLDLLAARPVAPRVEVEPFVELLLQVRQELRQAKQFALSDRIREGLRTLGIVVEDRPGGVTWKWERELRSHHGG